MVYPNPQIYHALKTIFVHVPKTAGTAIERTLLQGTKAVVGGHTTAMGFRSKYPEHFGAYFKFAIIRDPVDRFISAYSYLRQEPIHPAHNNQVIHDCQSLDHFVTRIQEEPAIIHNLVHLLPQHRFICDQNGKILVDAIYPYDDLPRAWEDISEKIGLSHSALPKLNVSRSRTSSPPSPELKATIKRLYRDDYTLFGSMRQQLPLLEHPI